jgi:hypothetical protein
MLRYCAAITSMGITTGHDVLLCAGQPGYDPSTLHLPPAALKALNAFSRQFWKIKARCMELVLFVRHGSFYNLFDVDADVGLRVGLNISGRRTPNMWKVGSSSHSRS